MSVPKRNVVNVVNCFKQCKSFVYLTEREEEQLGFAAREFRPLTKFRLGKEDCFYLGQWRIGKDIIEGRGVIFSENGTVYEGYVRKNKIDAYGRYVYCSWNSYQGEFS